MPLSDSVSIPLPYQSPRVLERVTVGGTGSRIPAVITRPRMRAVPTVSGTNLLLWTDDLSQIIWEKEAGLTVAASSITTPDPERTATVVTTTGAGLLLDQTITIDILNTETAWFSVWMKTPADPLPVDLNIYQVYDGIIDTLNCTVTSVWTHFIMSRVFTENSAMKIGIIPQFIGDLHIFGPQIVDNVTNIVRYIPSTDEHGDHIIYDSEERFMMTEDPTKITGQMSEYITTVPLLTESI